MKPYIFVIFQGGGSGPPVPPLDPPMGEKREAYLKQHILLSLLHSTKYTHTCTTHNKKRRKESSIFKTAYFVILITQHYRVILTFGKRLVTKQIYR